MGGTLATARADGVLLPRWWYDGRVARALAAPDRPGWGVPVVLALLVGYAVSFFLAGPLQLPMGRLLDGAREVARSPDGAGASSYMALAWLLYWGTGAALWALFALELAVASLAALAGTSRWARAALEGTRPISIGPVRALACLVVALAIRIVPVLPWAPVLAQPVVPATTGPAVVAAAAAPAGPGAAPAPAGPAQLPAEGGALQEAAPSTAPAAGPAAPAAPSSSASPLQTPVQGAGLFGAGGAHAVRTEHAPARTGGGDAGRLRLGQDELGAALRALRGEEPAAGSAAPAPPAAALQAPQQGPGPARPSSPEAPAVPAPPAPAQASPQQEAPAPYVQNEGQRVMPPAGEARPQAGRPSRQGPEGLALAAGAPQLPGGGPRRRRRRYEGPVGVYVTEREGETLWSIAERLGDPLGLWPTLWELNAHRRVGVTQLVSGVHQPLPKGADILVPAPLLPAGYRPPPGAPWQEVAERLEGRPSQAHEPPAEVVLPPVDLDTWQPLPQDVAAGATAAGAAEVAAPEEAPHGPEEHREPGPGRPMVREEVISVAQGAMDAIARLVLRPGDDEDEGEEGAGPMAGQGRYAALRAAQVMWALAAAGAHDSVPLLVRYRNASSFGVLARLRYGEREAFFPEQRRIARLLRAPVSVARAGADCLQVDVTARPLRMGMQLSWQGLPLPVGGDEDGTTLYVDLAGAGALLFAGERARDACLAALASLLASLDEPPRVLADESRLPFAADLWETAPDAVALLRAATQVADLRRRGAEPPVPPVVALGPLPEGDEAASLVSFLTAAGPSARVHLLMWADRPTSAFPAVAVLERGRVVVTVAGITMEMEDLALPIPLSWHRALRGAGSTAPAAGPAVAHGAAPEPAGTEGEAPRDAAAPAQEGGDEGDAPAAGRPAPDEGTAPQEMTWAAGGPALEAPAPVDTPPEPGPLLPETTLPPDEEPVELGPQPLAPQAAGGRLRLQLWAGPQLVLGGEVVSLRSPALAAALALLAIHPEGLPTDDLLELVASHEDLEAVRVRLRKAADRFVERVPGGGRLLVRGRERWQLDPSGVDVDLWQLRDLWERAHQMSPDAYLARLAELLSPSMLAPAAFLSELRGFVFLDDERERAWQLVRSLALHGAEQALALRRYDLAAGLARPLFQADRCDERAAIALARALAAQGRRGEAARVLDEAMDALARQKVAPSQHLESATRALREGRV